MPRRCTQNVRKNDRKDSGLTPAEATMDTMPANTGRPCRTSSAPINVHFRLQPRATACLTTATGEILSDMHTYLMVSSQWPTSTPSGAVAESWARQAEQPERTVSAP